VEVQRPICRRYVGQDSAQEPAVCEKAWRVLFVDEAYELTPRGDNDYGPRRSRNC